MAAKWGIKYRPKRKTVKQIRESSEGRRLDAVAGAVFEHLVTGGWEAKRRRMQQGWPALDPEWAMRKGSTEMWKFTGRTIRELEVGKLAAPGRHGVLRLHVHYKRALASLYPNRKRAPTLASKGKGRAKAGSARARKGPLFQDSYRRLHEGSGRANYEAGEAGIKWGQRNLGRPLLVWDPGDEAPAAANVARALQSNFDQAGIGTTRKGR